MPQGVGGSSNSLQLPHIACRIFLVYYLYNYPIWFLKICEILTLTKNADEMVISLADLMDCRKINDNKLFQFHVFVVSSASDLHFTVHLG